MMTFLLPERVDRPLSERVWYLRSKRLFDVVSASLLLVLVLPLWALLALLVRLSSPGPVLFRQDRVGKDGVLFKILKFRTMREGPPGSLITEKGDPRITRIGAVLRKTKLDELPQLINVIKGDMSVVGPRPETPNFVSYYEEADREVLQLRPGLTDIATVSFRNEEELLAAADDHEKFYVDIVLRRKMRLKREYMKRAGFWFDLELIFLTIFKILLPGLVIFDSSELPRRMQYLLDIGIFATMFLLAYMLRFEGLPPGTHFKKMIFLMPYVTLLRWIALFLSGAYTIPWRSIRMDHLPVFIVAIGAPSLFFLAGRVFLPDSLHYAQVPYSVIAIDAMFAFGGIVGIRMLRRAVFEQRESSRRTDPVLLPRTLVIGAGRMGHILAKETIDRKSPPFRLVGFLDDDPTKQGQHLLGFRVLGGVEDLPIHVQRLNVEQVIVAVTQIDREQVRRILRVTRHTPVRLKITPPVFREVDGRIDLDLIWKVQVEDLLGRRIPNPDALSKQEALVRPMISGKRVLVSGAGGSIGRELVRTLLRYEPADVMLIDNDENALFVVGLDLDRIAPAQKRRIVIGDIRNTDRMRDCFKSFRPQIVLHAAAYKHVPMMEANAIQAVENNVFGTQTLVDLSESYEVERFVMLSTDKAYKPVSVMGATKRLAELMVLGNKGATRTRFACVRFGNVIGSRGSVVPTFMDQIDYGGPVTVTDQRATRFFMTVQEAARLVLVATGLTEGGETFLLDMGEPISIQDLAKDLIYLKGKSTQTIPIVETGLRPGERLHELKLTDESGARKTEVEKVYIAPMRPIDLMAVRRWLDELRTLVRTGADRDIKEMLAQMPLDYSPLPEADAAASKEAR
jgi:FlaA1/EpsC-like NDP-sugar epimerase/lipopolysaccharide/colanic/teichoic acid biosynthesis glycosyltransferase